MLLIRITRLSLTAFTLMAALLLLLASTFILPTSILHQNSLTTIDGSVHLHRSLQSRSDYSPPSESTDENDYDDDGDIDMGDDDYESSSDDAERGPMEWDEYARKGALAAEYLKASDANVVADLVQKGKLPPGSGLASRFTDVRDLAANGWAVRDVTQRLRDGFEQYVPFRDALKDLGLFGQRSTRGQERVHGLRAHAHLAQVRAGNGGTAPPSLRQFTYLR